MTPDYASLDAAIVKATDAYVKERLARREKSLMNDFKFYALMAFLVGVLIGIAIGVCG